MMLGRRFCDCTPDLGRGCGLSAVFNKEEKIMSKIVALAGQASRLRYRS